MSKLLYKLNRFYNMVYAFIFAYFWLPCPRCGEYFGGHEWNLNDPNQSIYNNHTGYAICKNCANKTQ